MKIGIQLAELRKERGISQERLAGEIGVSRQAVTKWESGETLPDIERLAALSFFFGVTIDSLVRGGDDSCASRKSPSRLPSAPKARSDGLFEFLCRAKRATYAGGGAECASSRPASRDLSYAEPPYAYYDTYLGGERFSGEEAVWRDGTPVWAMNYTGRTLGELFSGDFLKEALCGCTPEMPFRGPSVFVKNDYSYHCVVTGDTDWFQGYEEILVHGDKAYECFFHGGTVCA